MANTDTQRGVLDKDDIIFQAPINATPPVFTRADEYDLNTSAIGQLVTLSLTADDPTKYDTFLQVINAETGQVIADSDDNGANLNSVIASGQPNQVGLDDLAIPNFFSILGGIKYKVRVTSYDSLDLSSTHGYSLQAIIPTGDISLVPRGSSFSGSPLTDTPAVRLNGKLEGSKDFTFPAFGGGNTLADEFQVTTSLDGQPLNISLSSTTTGFDPYVELVNLTTGVTVGDNNNGGGLNAQLTGVPRQANTNYRIRVTSNTPFPSATVPDYNLQVTVPQGSVTLTPRIGDTPIITPPTTGGGTPTGGTPTGGTPTGGTPTGGTPTGGTPTGGTPTGGTPTGGTPTGGTPTGGTPTGGTPTGGTPTGGTPVAIAAPAINAPAPGNPTGQPANTVSGEFYNLSDSNDNIVLSSLPPAAAGKQILALSGNDNITGTSGIDNINGMQGADTIDGGSGNDILSGGKGSDSLDGGVGDDQIFGSNDNDTLTGGEGNDTIRGGKENDVLIGGNGDDLLSGDRGQDILTGGGGSDTFILGGGQAAAARLGDADVIVDFTNGDRIGLTDGNTFASLTFEAVSLNLNGGSPVSSTAIKLGTNYLGVVQGVAQSELTANVFVLNV
ncbi:calcium-binding protein [Lyngbya sp. CCAP 1446/10]|uniref:calcium-binding protein n=1 Tax=Lyngbya sp. CCAP 1446/10 TaxID=439293 RepID=UPI00223736B5|nr:calcium-binding protein [Lyngbya sp. CCAP 1446/10]MCW6049518.1 calcium-binding protein [Lyngbya sp. CCAP 1446/10]